MTGGKSAGHADEAGGDADDLEQEDKPRSRIVAEYLAHGYAIGDEAIQRALALDQKHGVSNRFTKALADFDNKFKATDKAKAVDSSYGITEKIQAGWRGLNTFYEKAIGTPTGQRLAALYTQGDKQVRDVHAEARRLADLKKKNSGGGDSYKCKCGGEVSKSTSKWSECTRASCRLLEVC